MDFSCFQRISIERPSVLIFRCTCLLRAEIKNCVQKNTPLIPDLSQLVSSFVSLKRHTGFVWFRKSIVQEKTVRKYAQIGDVIKMKNSKFFALEEKKLVPLSSKRRQEKISDSLFNEGILYRHILPHLLSAKIPVVLEECHLKAVSRAWCESGRRPGALLLSPGSNLPGSIKLHVYRATDPEQSSYILFFDIIQKSPLCVYLHLRETNGQHIFTNIEYS